VPRIASALFVAVLFALARGAAAADGGPHMEDRGFLLAAIVTSAAQEQAGRLAVERAADERVRGFARAMLGYHEAARARLDGAARGHGVEPPNGVDPAAARWIDGLGRLAGPAFDAEYMHGQEINLHGAGYVYRRQARFGTDPGLRQEAERQVEDSDGHRREAQRIAADLGEPPADPLHLEDETFLVYAADVDRTQLRFGELALERAEDDRVREFARHMLDAHGQAARQGERAAQANGLQPLKDISPAAQALEAHLKGLDGPRFDREYMISQVIHHYTWFYRFERQAIQGRDAVVRELAAKGARDGKGHHDMARAIVDGAG
jgi:putative membrane protein